MEIINEKENKLFNRKEIQINIEAEITPSHEEAKKLISEKFSTQPENIRIKKILGKFGSKVFEISANIYFSEEEKNKTEIFSKKEKERERKPEPASPGVPSNTELQGKKTEAPVEEKQEEIKEKSNEVN
ncbi:hypothetical protein KAT80_01940 [Candidatus Pacearchaeota archaeon]|nr:hypothetical protein [Candidatus Pacearchaeota archaeon]